MKIAVTGKGGVGKTALAATLARCWQADGYRVVAVDADPDGNLAAALGYRGTEIAPLSSLKALIEDRVGGGWSGFLKLNPRVDDIPDDFGIEVDGVRVLVMGTVEKGRSGCACPQNVLLREVVSHLVLVSRDRVVLDMEAGLEHLGRGTAEGVDDVLVVVEPGWASLRTADKNVTLARDLGIPRIRAVANKITNEEDRGFIDRNLDLPVLTALPMDPHVESDARDGVLAPDRPFYSAVRELAQQMGDALHTERKL